MNIEALRLAKEVENIKINTDIFLSVNAMSRLVAEQYKKAHNSTDQSMRNEHEQLFNDIIPPGTGLDNDEIYDIKTGQTIGELE